MVPQPVARCINALMTGPGAESPLTGGDAVNLVNDVRLWVGVVLLAATVVACGASDQPAVSSPWGGEAGHFFEGLSQVYAENDFYGVLDYYTTSAYVEKWRGDLRGGAVVPDLLRWNSGDLDHEILALHLSSDGALTLVRWPTTGELGAVISVIEQGLIAGETVFDLGVSLERSLRASPGTISTYEDLYAAYARAWSRKADDDLTRLYAPDARLHDPLAGIEVSGHDAISASGGPGRSVEVITAGDVGESNSSTNPAIYLGPSEYGQDPNRAVGVYRAIDDEGCAHQVAVVWLLEDGLIVDEHRYHELESFPDCVSGRLPEGWWTGLPPPPPRDEVVTGVMQTGGGQNVTVHNGSRRLEQVLLGGMQRFVDAEMDQPRFDVVTFEPSRSCVDRSGRVLQTTGSRGLFICIYESDLCPRGGPCDVAPLPVRLTVLHELAHVWMLDHVDDETRAQVLERTGRRRWQDDTGPWSERGVEYSADVIAWGLLDDAAPMVRIGNPTCDELTASFKLLTATDPLRADCTGT